MPCCMLTLTARLLLQVLLNSLRRLLTVVPQTEHLLSQWCEGPAPVNQPGTPGAASTTPAREGAASPGLGGLTQDGPGEAMVPRS